MHQKNINIDVLYSTDNFPEQEFLYLNNLKCYNIILNESGKALH